MRIKKAPGGLGVFEGAILQGFSERLQGCQRCAQFVGDVADEIAANRFQVAHAGEILDEQQTTTAVAVGDGDELQELAGIGHLHRLHLHLTAFLAEPPGFDQLMLAEDLGDVAAGLIIQFE